ncbi:MAG: hypothetical protein DRJ41_02395 [Thermoprotei archaeon]|nr:MAG: hypothetical protein DRJ41_02395 [Thermoprotei archaeon]
MKGVKDLIISEEGRKILSMPIGIVIYKEPSDALEILRDLVDNYNPPLIITVGDVVTGNLLKRKFKVNIAILDGKTLRKEIIEYKYIIDTFDIKIKCENPSGFLRSEALFSVKKAIQKAKEGNSVVIVVEGEEDLLGVPALLYSPKKTMIIYGYWKGGIAIIFSCKYLRKSFNKLLKKYFVKVKSCRD